MFAVFLIAPAARGQAGPLEGGHELQVWTGGGHGISGSQSGDSVWNAGFRYGLILTAPHGPGFLRGRLEYALDAVPVFVFRATMKTGTAARAYCLRRRRKPVPGGALTLTAYRKPALPRSPTNCHA